MLFDAVIKNNILKLKKEIELGADIHAVDHAGWSALVHASRYGHIEIVKLLLEAGSDIHAVSKNDLTPLMYASLDDSYEVSKLLLEAGSDINDLFKIDYFEDWITKFFYQDYIEKNLQLLSTENFKKWKVLRLKNLFV